MNNRKKRREVFVLKGSILTIFFLMAVQSYLWPPGAYGNSQESFPRPPCQGDPFPSFSALETPPHVQLWEHSTTTFSWEPPSCLLWEDGAYTVMLAVAGRFQEKGKMEAILDRLGSVSKWTTIRYWSVTRGRWHDLFSDAFALSGPDPEKKRGNFIDEELKSGANLYLWQNESSPAGASTYRLRVHVRNADRLVFGLENIDPVNILFLTLFDPGGYQFFYHLERETDDVWKYYSLFRAMTPRQAMVLGHGKSMINRGVAIFRYLAGLPTDGEVPLAP